MGQRHMDSRSSMMVTRSDIGTATSSSVESIRLRSQHTGPVELAP